MKKAKLFFIFTLTVILALLMLSGCKKEDVVTSISLKDHEADSVIEMAVGNFNYGAHTVVVEYSSGNEEEIALTEEMIDEVDLFKFYQVGEHDITVCYGNAKCKFKVSVKRSTFGELSLPEAKVYTYDGTPHTVEVEGDMPANAVVTYVGGNSFVNAGTYDVTAVVTCEGYVTVRLSTTVKIERAKYDMSGITFEAKEFVYDGAAHSVEIAGTLPEGVAKPTYVINEKVTSSATDVGDYTVTARFANNNPNYETIPDMVTTLKITPAEFDIKDVDLIFKNEGGKLIDGESMIYDGTMVSVDVNDYNNLSNKVAVSFSILDKDGNEISTSNKTTNIKNAGVYTVKLSFELADSQNYKPIEPIVKEFEIKKAKYDMRDVHFDNDVLVFDGKVHKIEVELPIDHDITAADVSYEYYLNGELLVDSEGDPVTQVAQAGEYTVIAKFTVKDDNYEPISDMQAKLIIESDL